jgi:hypothetical protein
MKIKNRMIYRFVGSSESLKNIPLNKYLNIEFSYFENKSNSKMQYLFNRYIDVSHVGSLNSSSIARSSTHESGVFDGLSIARTTSSANRRSNTAINAYPNA